MFRTSPSRSASRHVQARHALSRVGWLIAVLAALTLSAQQPSMLGPQIETIISEPETQTAFWGIYVQDVQSGDVLYSHNAELPMLPASNQKILTTATILDALGSEYRYQTKLLFDGSTEGATMKGDLILDGSGDPSFGSSKMGGGDPLRHWARTLAAMGVRRIEGRIVGDDDAFDDRPYAEGWDIDYITSQSSRSLGVSASGLPYHDNLVEIQVQSAGVGDPPQVNLRPAGSLEIENRATTSSRRRGWALDMQRTFGTNTVQLSGSLPRSYRGTVEMPVADPTAFALQSFKQYLQDAGIEVAGEVVDIDELENSNYDDAEPLFVHLSPPLRDIVSLVNKESNNFYAEQLFRTFAWGGSADGGGRRVKELMSRAGINTDVISVRDGSGLSRKNMITVEAMGRLLAYMYKHGEQAAFKTSLAQGGEPRTTLRYRLGNQPVQAKTGSLEFVRTLSGYAQTSDGRTVAFAVFANNYTGPSYRITQAIDRIVMAITAGTVS